AGKGAAGSPGRAPLVGTALAWSLGGHWNGASSLAGDARRRDLLAGRDLSEPGAGPPPRLRLRAGGLGISRRRPQLGLPRLRSAGTQGLLAGRDSGLSLLRHGGSRCLLPDRGGD